NLFLALLAANLLFLAWARWVDTPPEPTRQDAVARLPRLMLVTEAPPAPKRTSASAQKMIFRDPEGTCTSIGPFNDLASAVKAAAALTERGFSPRQRVEEGETVEGYWVYVGGMGSDDDVARVVQRLEKSGFTDAHVMKEAAEGRRVSVGLFSKRERAEHRALAVQHMGLDPQIAERRFPGTVYWVDVARALADPPHAKRRDSREGQRSSLSARCERDPRSDTDPDCRAGRWRHPRHGTQDQGRECPGRALAIREVTAGLHRIDHVLGRPALG